MSLYFVARNVADDIFYQCQILSPDRVQQEKKRYSHGTLWSGLLGKYKTWMIQPLNPGKRIYVCNTKCTDLMFGEIMTKSSHLEKEPRASDFHSPCMALLQNICAASTAVSVVTWRTDSEQVERKD